MTSLRKLISNILASIFGSTKPAVVQVTQKASSDRWQRDNAILQAHNAIFEAEQLLAQLKVKAVEQAKANEKALIEAIAIATAEQKEAESRRQDEIQYAKDENDQTIKALEEAIAAARANLSDELSELAIKHAGERQSAAAAITDAQFELSRQIFDEESNS